MILITTAREEQGENEEQGEIEEQGKKEEHGQSGCPAYQRGRSLHRCEVCLDTPLPLPLVQLRVVLLLLLGADSAVE